MSIEQIMNTLEEYTSYISIAHEYGEPGYDNDGRLIVFADWNDVPSDIVDTIKESYVIEWSDEWVISDTGKAYRCTPDSYSWQPSFVLDRYNDIVSIDELLDDTDYLREHVEDTYVDNPDNAINMSRITDEHLKNIGAELLSDDLESGFHSHMTDDPKTIYEDWRKKGYTDLFFRIDSQSQFYITFQLWTLNNQEEKN